MLPFRVRIMLGLLMLAVGMSACASSTTPKPGKFETAVAATVESGSTQIAQNFADTRATLTASAPTITLTPTPTDTPSNTPTPTETPTPKDTPTRTLRPPTPTNTFPPPPTATRTPSPVLPGTYAQAGACTNVPAFITYYMNNNYHTMTVGGWAECVVSVVVRDSGEMQFNVTWTLSEIHAPNWVGRVGRANLAPWNGSSHSVHLTDHLGNRYDFTQLAGAANTGGNEAPGGVLYGYYVFPRPLPGAYLFALNDTDQKRSIGNIILSNPAP